jgi:hypothetical protein
MVRRKTTEARATDTPVLTNWIRRSHSSLVQSLMSKNPMKNNAECLEKFRVPERIALWTLESRFCCVGVAYA